MDIRSIIQQKKNLVKGTIQSNFKETILEKAKYFKREGTPGNYKYYYTEEEYKKAKGGGKEKKTILDKDTLIGLARTFDKDTFIQKVKDKEGHSEEVKKNTIELLEKIYAGEVTMSSKNSHGYHKPKHVPSKDDGKVEKNSTPESKVVGKIMSILDTNGGNTKDPKIKESIESAKSKGITKQQLLKEVNSSSWTEHEEGEGPSEKDDIISIIEDSFNWKKSSPTAVKVGDFVVLEKTRQELTSKEKSKIMDLLDKGESFVVDKDGIKNLQ